MTATLPRVAPGAFEQPDLYVARQSFSVPYAFDVAFCRDIFAADSRVLVDVLRRLDPVAESSRLLVFIDDGVVAARPSLVAEIVAHVAAHAPALELAALPIGLAGGEGVKNGMAAVTRMQSLMVQHRIDRHSYVVAIGGGAILDAVGLAAATAHRGIRHIRIPTTVLSQNDSGVGVKNGVNLFGAKNYFGTFAPPSAVINDHDFIEILPAREQRAGIAEAVKVALIRDRRFFEWLERSGPDLARFQTDAMRRMIRRCAELHMRQIGQGGDPFERGTARPLDFGHWSAHRLETLSDFSLRHGEAVAIGIALDTEYSVLAGLLEVADAARVHSVLRQLGFSLYHPLMDADATHDGQLLQGLREFQEHLGGRLTITLLAGIGTGIEVHEIDHDLMIRAIANLGLREGSA